MCPFTLPLLYTYSSQTLTHNPPSLSFSMSLCQQLTPDKVVCVGYKYVRKNVRFGVICCIWLCFTIGTHWRNKTASYQYTYIYITRHTYTPPLDSILRDKTNRVKESPIHQGELFKMPPPPKKKYIHFKCIEKQISTPG